MKPLHLLPVLTCLFGLAGAFVSAGEGKSVQLTAFASATASSEEKNRGNLIRHAVDGNPDTRWCSNGMLPGSWLSLDLGGPCLVTQVVLSWEQETAYRYKLEGSLDGKSWTTLTASPSVETTGKGTHEMQHRLRHLRTTHLNPSVKVWSSIREVQVWGVPE